MSDFTENYKAESECTENWKADQEGKTKKHAY